MESPPQDLLRGPDSDVILLKSFKDLSSCVRVDDFTDISALQGFTLESYVARKEKYALQNVPNFVNCVLDC